MFIFVNKNNGNVLPGFGPRNPASEELDRQTALLRFPELSASDLLSYEVSDDDAQRVNELMFNMGSLTAVISGGVVRDIQVNGS
jgi:hypothetical protein